MIHSTIKMFRTLRGLTQKQMAEQLHKSQSAYSRMENGDLVISTDDLKDIATVLGCDIEDLLKGQAIIDVLQQKSQARSYHEQQAKDPEEFTAQYKELLQLVVTHQEKTNEELKAFVKDTQQQMLLVIKEIISAIKKQ